MHSLALRALQAAGALTAYPADPVVLQRWELREIFEVEFGETCGVGSIRRRELGDSLLALSTPRAATAAGRDLTAGDAFEPVIWCADVDDEAARLRAAGAERAAARGRVRQ